LPRTRLTSFTHDPFGVPELGDHLRRDTAPGGLVDTDAARSWAMLHDPCMEAGLYTWQLPLQQRASARSVARESPLTLFSAYGYLDLNGHPRVMAAAHDAIDRFGTSPAGARMLTGTLELHLEVERAIADFIGVESATTFAGGYDANVAAIATLFGKGDLIVLDSLAHRSLNDAAKLAGSELRRFRHNDLEHLTAILDEEGATGRRTLIVVDGVYSMDGDEAPLAELVALKSRYGAFLLVDEAHAIGTMGPTGRGTWEAQGVDPRSIDIITGSLSKGIPATGGFVAGSHSLRSQMQHGAAPYFFSCALSPASAAAALEGLAVIQEEPEHLARLRANSDTLRAGLAARGFETSQSTSAIVPLLLGDEGRAFTWARDMLLGGVAVSAIPYPAVPAGQSRIRLCATAGHRAEHFEHLFQVIDDCLEGERGAVATRHAAHATHA
jgi:8-amino-7-oxononanoate synthase